MTRVLSVAVLILVVALFPPATLALISNNAVPGDGTYPVKRGLEDVIYKIASLNPTTRAWFAAARSDRRFEEIKILLTSGRSAKDSLNELVTQTDIAVKQIQKVEDPQKKKELIVNLKQSIEKYDQGLLEIKKSYEEPSKAVLPPQVPSPAPQVTETPPPALLTTPSPTPLLLPSPTPVISPPPEVVDIEETREDLEEIKKELEEEKELLEMEKVRLHQKDDKSNDRREKRDENDYKRIDKEDSERDKKDD